MLVDMLWCNHFDDFVTFEECKSITVQMLLDLAGWQFAKRLKNPAHSLTP